MMTASYALIVRAANEFLPNARSWQPKVTMKEKPSPPMRFLFCHQNGFDQTD
jgi:hypothetical protein